ncbi:MAG TPA: cytochrome c [Opitutaceae bacterium]
MKLGKPLKYAGLGVAGLLTLVLVAVGGVYGASHRKLTRKHDVTVRPVAVASDAATIARGKHLVTTRGCADCHGADLGGFLVINDPMVGRLAGPNLTAGRGGLPMDYSDTDYVRAIRHGLARDGRALMLMPSLEYQALSDEDLGAMIAYLKTVPAVDRERGPVAPGPISRLLIVNGEMKLSAEHIDHTAVRPVSVAAGISADYGRYLAASCTGCHGENFAGGRIPGAPPDWPAAANLTPHAGNGISSWNEAAFIATLRTAKRPDGSAVSPVMPAAIGQMTDDELKALWAYLRTLAPVAPAVKG